MRSAAGQGDHVVERNFVSPQVLVAEVAGALIPLDDRPAVNAFDLRSGTESGTATVLLVEYLVRVRLTVLALIARLTCLDLFRVGCLPSLGGSNVLAHVFSSSLSGACAFARLTEIRSRPAVHEEAGQRVPAYAIRTLAQLHPRADIEDVLFRLEFGILARLVRVSDLRTWIAIGSEAAAAILMQRSAELIKRQPFFAETTAFQAEIIVNRWAGLHSSILLGIVV